MSEKNKHIEEEAQTLFTRLTQNTDAGSVLLDWLTESEDGGGKLPAAWETLRAKIQETLHRPSPEAASLDTALSQIESQLAEITEAVRTLPGEGAPDLQPLEEKLDRVTKKLDAWRPAPTEPPGIERPGWIVIGASLMNLLAVLGIAALLFWAGVIPPRPVPMTTPGAWESRPGRLPPIVITVMPPTLVVTVAPSAGRPRPQTKEPPPAATPKPEATQTGVPSPTAETPPKPTGAEAVSPAAQPPSPPVQVVITGPITLPIGTAAAFTAVVNLTATLPITYIWQSPGAFTTAVTVDLTTTPLTEGQVISNVQETAGPTTITHTSGLSDAVVLLWSNLGPQTLTVTARNAGGDLAVTHDVTVTALTRVEGASLVERKCGKGEKEIQGIPTFKKQQGKMQPSYCLSQDQLIAIIGRNEEGSYYLIRMVGRESEKVWVQAADIQLPPGVKPEYLVVATE